MKIPIKSPLTLVIAGLLIYLLIIVVDVRYSWLFSKEYPNSTDGFFYLQEFKHRLLYGTGYYLKYSLFFSLWTEAGELFGINELQIHNLIFVTSLMIFSAAILIQNSSNNYLAPLGLILMYFSSDLMFYRHYAFLKQGFSISLFFLGLAIFNKNNIVNKFYKYTGLILILAASLMHIYVSALAVIYLIFVLYDKLYNKKSVLFICTLCLIFLIYSLYSNPKHLFSLNSFQESGWWETCRILNCSEFEWQEFFIYSALLISLLLTALIRRNFFQNQTALAGLFVILLLNAPIWTEQGDMMVRLSVSSVWVLFILLSDYCRTKLQYASYPILLSSLVLVYCFMYSVKKSYSVNRLPYKKFEQYSQLLKDWIPEDSFILADHGLQFPITYFLNRKSSDKLPKSENVSNYYKLSYKEDYEVYSEECRSTDVTFENLTEINCISIDKNWNIHRLSKRK